MSSLPQLCNCYRICREVRNGLIFYGSMGIGWLWLQLFILFEGNIVMLIDSRGKKKPWFWGLLDASQIENQFARVSVI